MWNIDQKNYYQLVQEWAKKKKKMKNVFNSLTAPISGMHKGIFFKFGMWPP